MPFRLFFLRRKTEQIKFQEVRKMNAVQKAFYSGEDYENCYIFAPSISRRESVGRQTYYVRRYFRGGKDFEKTMKSIAVQRTTKNAR